MAVNEALDPRVRLAISQWPEDAPRGAVSTFCAEHGISRKSFYELRKRARADGELQAQVDAFDLIYNTARPHQALPGRLTPQAAWQGTPNPLAPKTNNTSSICLHLGTGHRLRRRRTCRRGPPSKH